MGLFQIELYTHFVTDRHIKEQERVKTNREKLVFCSSEKIKTGYFSLLLSQAFPWTAGLHYLEYLPPSQQPTKPHAGKRQSVPFYCKDCLPLFDQTEGNRRWLPSSLVTIKEAPNIVYYLEYFSESQGRRC